MGKWCSKQESGTRAEEEHWSLPMFLNPLFQTAPALNPSFLQNMDYRLAEPVSIKPRRTMVDALPAWLNLSGILINK